MKSVLSRFEVWFYFLAELILLAIFVKFQEIALNNAIFPWFMFSSFIFLGVGNFLLFKTFAKFFERQQRYCLMVAFIFIVTTAYVANSLVHVPRGGVWNRIYAKPNDYVELSLEKNGNGKYYAAHSQFIYLTKCPIAHLNVSAFGNQTLEIYIENPPKMHGTLDIFLIFRPYEVYSPPVFHTHMVFNDSSGSIYKFQEEICFSIVRGGVNPCSRFRFEGYALELILILEFIVLAEEAAPALIFGLNFTNLKVLINEFIVDSKLQNGLCVILSGIFIGFDLYITGRMVLPQNIKQKLFDVM